MIKRFLISTTTTSKSKSNIGIQLGKETPTLFLSFIVVEWVADIVIVVEWLADIVR